MLKTDATKTEGQSGRNGAAGAPGAGRFCVAGLHVRGLEPISFTLHKGDCLVVRGPSGCGKSMLLRALADLDPAAGRVSLNGLDRDQTPATKWRRLVRYQAAESGWWADHVADHFHNARKARTMAEKLGLCGDLLDREVAGLSSGERQRLAFVRAMEDRPPVLLFDEPTSALDEEAEELMEKQMRAQLDEGAIIVLVTHKNAQDQRFASQRLLIADGKWRMTAR